MKRFKKGSLYKKTEPNNRGNDIIVEITKVDYYNEFETVWYKSKHLSKSYYDKASIGWFEDNFVDLTPVDVARLRMKDES